MFFSCTAKLSEMARVLQNRFGGLRPRGDLAVLLLKNKDNRICYS